MFLLILEWGDWPFLILVFIGVWLLYSVLLVSAVWQSELAICTPISPLFWIPLRPLIFTTHMYYVVKKKKSSLCLQVKRHLIAISITSKVKYEFYAIPVKVPLGYFVDKDKLITKFIQRDKRLRISNSHWRSRTELKVGGLTLPNIMTYYWSKVIVIMYSRQARQRNQRNRDPRNRPI